MENVSRSEKITARKKKNIFVFSLGTRRPVMASLGTLPGEHKELLGGLLIGIAAGVTISR